MPRKKKAKVIEGYTGKYMERDADGKLTPSMVEYLMDSEKVKQLLIDFLNFNLRTMLDELLQALVEAGWSAHHIGNVLTEAAKRTNYQKNTFVRERMEGEGIEPHPMAHIV